MAEARPVAKAEKPVYGAATSKLQGNIREIMKTIGQHASPIEARVLSANIIDEGTNIPMSSFSTIAAVLRFRAHLTESAVAITALDSKGKTMNSITYGKLNSKACKIAQMIKEKTSLAARSKVALIYSRQEIVEYTVALFGIFYAGMTAVPIVPCNTTVAEEMADIENILTDTKITLLLTTDSSLKILQREMDKPLSKSVECWKTSEFGSYHQPKKGAEEVLSLNAGDSAYYEYTRDANGALKCILIDHSTILAECNKSKYANNLLSSDVVFSVIEPRQQYGFLNGLLCSLFCGSTFLYSCHEICAVPGLWIKTACKNKGTS